MNNKFSKAISKFFHDMSIADLRLHNADYSNSKLTYNSMLYLNMILGHQGEYTVSTIAQMLHVAKPAVTQKINELEHMGYIIKRQSETDKRIYYLFVTEKVNYTESECKKSDAYVEKKLSETYSQEEIDMFCKMLSFVGDMYLEENK